MPAQTITLLLLVAVFVVALKILKNIFHTVALVVILAVLLRLLGWL